MDFSIASWKCFSLTLIFAMGNFTKLNGNLFSNSLGNFSCGVACTHSLEGISRLLVISQHQYAIYQQDSFCLLVTCGCLASLLLKFMREFARKNAVCITYTHKTFISFAFQHFSLCFRSTNTPAEHYSLLYLTSGTFPSSWSLKKPLKFLKGWNTENCSLRPVLEKARYRDQKRIKTSASVTGGASPAPTFLGNR